MKTRVIILMLALVFVTGANAQDASVAKTYCGALVKKVLAKPLERSAQSDSAYHIQTDDEIVDDYAVSNKPYSNDRALYDALLNQEIAAVEPKKIKTPKQADQYFDTVDQYNPGREYYDSLIDMSLEKRWAVQASFYSDSNNKGFNQDGDLVSLGASSFGSFQIKDVFLLANLANMGLLHTQFSGQPGIPQFSSPVPEQYLNLISTTNVGLNANQNSQVCDLSAMYRFNVCWWEEALFTLGVTLPVKAISNSLDVTMFGGHLERLGFTTQPGQRQSAAKLFFESFVSIEDFFIRAVLAPKGIAYVPKQQAIGLGDLSIFGFVDLAAYRDYLDALQLGINIVVPTGKNPSGNVLFQPAFGNGVGTLIDLYANVIFKTSSAWFNPTLYIAGEFGATPGGYNTNRRVSQVKSQAVEEFLIQNPTLLVPIYREYYSFPFSKLDSTIPALADSVFKVNVKAGAKVVLGLGNYFYDVFNTRFRLGMYYNYLHKDADTITAPEGVTGLATDQLAASSVSQAHKFGWNLAYKTKNLTEIAIGSQHIFAGKNVSHLQEFFVSLVLVF